MSNLGTCEEPILQQFTNFSDKLLNNLDNKDVLDGLVDRIQGLEAQNAEADANLKLEFDRIDRYLEARDDSISKAFFKILNLVQIL